MHIRCPHCHHPVDVISDDFSDFVCPSCGSRFSLISGETTGTRHGDAGRTIGHFQLVEQVGIGAFGSVWKARDTQLERMVAVKIPRRGKLEPNEADAFFREARAAAQLQHPHIVGVHEVGREDDTIYIVSDFIEGANLKEWLSTQRFSPREASQLVARIADALHHAHESGVVHRDLKPSNIMLDLDGNPHITDFGLAKREQSEMTVTVEGRVMGTPVYMSPEQAKGEGHHADRRSDVYSLGVILFELLTGELPFRGEAQMVLLQIQRDEPPRPRKLNARIPRDLQTVTLKCLEKDPGKRYQTASALADDLRRWLRGEPIHARPAGRVARGWRWCKRNRAVASLTAVVLLLLALSTVGALLFAGRMADLAASEQMARATADARAKEAVIERERAAVNAELASAGEQRANLVSKILVEVFDASALQRAEGIRFGAVRSPGPKGAQDPELTAREILDRGARQVVEELKDQPAFQAGLLDTIGNVYIGLGLPDQADPLLSSALEIRRRLYPEPHLDTAVSLYSLAVARASQLRFADSMEAMREAWKIREGLLGADHRDTIDTKFMVAFGMLATQEINEETEALLRETLEWRAAHLGKEHPQTAFCMIALAATLASRGRVVEAVPLFTSATAALVKVPATKSFGLAMNEDQQAQLMWQLKQWKSAADISAKAVVHFLEFSADDHPLFSEIADTHVRSLQLAGRLAEAKQFCRDWLQRLRDRASPGHTWAMRLLLRTLVSTAEPDDLNEAEALCREWLKMTEQPGRQPTAYDAELPHHFTQVLSRKAARTRDPKDLDEAERFGRQAIETAKASLAPRRGKQEGNNPKFILFTSDVVALGSLLRVTGRQAQAEALYRESLTLTATSSDSFHTMRLTRELADLLQAQMKTEEAEPLYREALKLADSARFANPELTKAAWVSSAMFALGDCLLAQSKGDEAESVFRKVVALGDTDWAPQAKARLTELASANKQ